MEAGASSEASLAALHWSVVCAAAGIPPHSVALVGASMPRDPLPYHSRPAFVDIVHARWLIEPSQAMHIRQASRRD